MSFTLGLGTRLGSKITNPIESPVNPVSPEVAVTSVMSASRVISTTPSLTSAASIDVPASGLAPSLSSQAGNRTTYFVAYYLNDPNGCPVRVTDDQGTTLWAASYDAWAIIEKTHTSLITNPIRLQGQYEDKETGFHYNRFRYYDPRNGQFITKDPLGMIAGENFYRYAPSSISWIDPLGLTSLGHTGADGKGYTIYALVDKASGKVKYVGMTEDARFWDRMNEHATSGRMHGGLESIELDSASTYAEARGKEQFHIDQNPGVMNTEARGKAFGPGTEGNRQVGFNTLREDGRGIAYKRHYDEAAENLPTCRV